MATALTTITVRMDLGYAATTAAEGRAGEPLNATITRWITRAAAAVEVKDSSLIQALKDDLMFQLIINYDGNWNMAKSNDNNEKKTKLLPEYITDDMRNSVNPERRTWIEEVD